MTYHIYNATKYKILKAVKELNDNDTPATVGNIARACDLPARNVRSSIAPYVTYGYLSKKTTKNPSMLRGARYQYAITDYGQKTLLKLQFRVDRGLSLNFRKPVEPVKSYVRTSRAEKDSAAIANRILCAVIPSVVPLADAMKSNDTAAMTHIFDNARAAIVRELPATEVQA